VPPPPLAVAEPGVPRFPPREWCVRCVAGSDPVLSFLIKPKQSRGKELNNLAPYRDTKRMYYSGYLDLSGLEMLNKIFFLRNF
jgi:hypothetical protein